MTVRWAFRMGNRASRAILARAAAVGFFTPELVHIAQGRSTSPDRGGIGRIVVAGQGALL
jgi:hypothetical protein